MFWRSGCPSIEHPYSERSSEDYITHRTRMPVVESAVYDYPNAHLIIKEERVIPEEQGGMYGNWSNYNFPSGNHRSYRAPEAHKKVHFLERDIISELGRNGKYEVTEEKIVNNDGSFIQREDKSNRNKYNFPSGYRHGSPAPEAQKKAHFVEHDKITEVGRNGKHKVTEEKVDNEADSFIKRKHKNFELAKMDTFKVY